MIECVLSNPVTVEVKPLPELFEKLRLFCDSDSFPHLHAFEQADIENPLLGKTLKVCPHLHERMEYRDRLAESLMGVGKSLADPAVVFSTLLELSGEAQEVTDRRRNFMAQGKTLLCVPLVYVHAFGGHVHVIVHQNQCEHKRGQRPWAIRYLLGETRIRPVYDTFAILNE